MSRHDISIKTKKTDAVGVQSKKKRVVKGTSTGTEKSSAKGKNAASR